MSKSIRIARSIAALDEKFNKKYSKDMAKKLFDDTKRKLSTLNGITKVEALDKKIGDWRAEVFFQISTSGNKLFYIHMTVNGSGGTSVYVKSLKTKSEYGDVISNITDTGGYGIDEAVDAAVECANDTIKILSGSKNKDEIGLSSGSGSKNTYEIGWDGRGMELSCDFWLKGVDASKQQAFQDLIWNAFHNSISMHQSRNGFGVNTAYIHIYGKEKITPEDYAKEPLIKIINYLKSFGYEMREE